MQQSGGQDAVRHTVRFEDGKSFLEEFKANICHGGMFLQWPDAPEKDSVVRIVLEPPCGLEPLEIEATVVFPSPAGVGVELKDFGAVRPALEALVEQCKGRLAEDTRRAEEAAAKQASVPGPVTMPPEAASIPVAPLPPEPGDLRVSPRASSEPRTNPGSLSATQIEANGPQVGEPGEAAVERSEPCPQGSVSPQVVAAYPPPQGQAPPPGQAHFPQGHPPQPGPFPAGIGHPGGGPPARPARPESMTPSWQGSLAEVSPTKILRTLNQRSATGVLVLKAEDSTYKLFHRGGLVAQVVEEPLDEKTLFGQLLIVETLVSKLELEAGLEQAKEKELPIGQILVKRRSLPASTVGKTLRKQLHGKILKAVRLSEGSFEFFDRVRPPKGPPLPPSNAPRIIFRGSVDTYRVRLRQEMEEIEAPYINEYLYPSESAPDDMFLVGLNDEEVRFWGLCVTGGYTLRDVFNVSNINRRSSHGLVFSLLEMDLVEFKHEMRPELQAKRMQKLLSKKDGQLGKASHFAALEVHWMAHEKELEAAYNARKAEFDCSSIKEHLSPETIAFAKGILARIDEAYKALRSHEARQRHRHEFLEMAQIHFHVDLLLQQGEMAIFKNDRREAEDRFVHVLEIMPGHKEAKAKLQSIRTMPTG